MLLSTFRQRLPSRVFEICNYARRLRALRLLFILYRQKTLLPSCQYQRAKETILAVDEGGGSIDAALCDMKL